MKQMTQILSDWLARQSQANLILTLLNLYETSGLYIVDKNQQIIYWSPGAEILSKLKADDVTGKPCLPEYAITESSDQKIKISRVLYDSHGEFSGGLGLLPKQPTARTLIDGSVPVSEKQSFQGLISRSPAMQAVFKIIQNAAETEATVLARGESGSGKELVAKAIHNLSARRNAPFLAINCAALSSSLLDSELFGHVRGAFTGAVKDHNGLFQRAHGSNWRSPKSSLPMPNDRSTQSNAA